MDENGSRKDENVAVSGVLGGGWRAFGVGGTIRLFDMAVEIIYIVDQHKRER